MKVVGDVTDLFWDFSSQLLQCLCYRLLLFSLAVRCLVVSTPVVSFFLCLDIVVLASKNTSGIMGSGLIVDCTLTCEHSNITSSTTDVLDFIHTRPAVKREKKAKFNTHTYLNTFPNAKILTQNSTIHSLWGYI